MQDRDRKSAKGKPPISRHPLFPAVVALWFGALFGLGSMAIRPGLIEDMVLAAGIDTLIPAAAPPLGMTARLLLALTMAGLGGLIGGVLARRLARPAPEARTRRRGAVSSPSPAERFARPAGAAAYQAAPSDDEPESDFAPKRRSLAIDAQITPREMHEHAPLPGGPLILNVSDIDSDDFAAAPQTDLWSSGGRGFDETPDFARDFAPPRDFSAPAAHALPEMGDDPRVRAPQPASETDFELRSESYARIASMAGSAPSPIAGIQSSRADASVNDPPDFAPAPSAVSPAARFAPPETEHRRFDAPVQNELAQNEPNQGAPASPFAVPAGFIVEEARAAESEPEPARQPAFAPPAGSAAERLKSTELAELSPVELVERLAISLQRRRAAAPASPEADFAQAPLAEPHQAAAASISRLGSAEREAPVVPAEMPALAETRLEAAPRALPAALRPLSFDDEDEDIAEAPPFSLPPRQIAMIPVAPPAASETKAAAPDEAEEADLDDGYSSLLELSRQSANRAPGAKQTFIRIEEPDHAADDEFEPVVVFPGQASRLQAAEPAPAAPLAAAPFAAPAGESEPAGSGEPAAAPESAPAPAQPVRRFDNPAQQSPAGGAGRQDPEEAERALRSALATLQRMSGAA